MVRIVANEIADHKSSLHRSRRFAHDLDNRSRFGIFRRYLAARRRRRFEQMPSEPATTDNETDETEEND